MIASAKKEHILVVDDSPDTLEVLQRNLESRGYKVFTAPGAVEAIKILGTTAEFISPGSRQCPNITIGGRKISGSAQYYKRGILLQHGTFLVDINHNRMFSFLKVPWAKKLLDVLEASKKKLTSAKQELA